MWVCFFSIEGPPLNEGAVKVPGFVRKVQVKVGDLPIAMDLKIVPF